MGQKADIVRSKIINEADQLFYQQGYSETSFHDIASAVGISRGNFYYHFHSKDEILNAVIISRQQNFKRMLQELEDSNSDVRQRLFCYIDILTNNIDNIKQHGCPIGSLCTELAKLNHDLMKDIGDMVGMVREWLSAQFKLLGQGKHSAQLAMHLLARTQGIAIITNIFADEVFLQQEVAALKLWVKEISES